MLQARYVITCPRTVSTHRHPHLGPRPPSPYAYQNLLLLIMPSAQLCPKTLVCHHVNKMTALSHQDLVHSVLRELVLLGINRRPGATEAIRMLN